MIHLVKDQSGSSKGFGFVEFIDEESLQKAVKDKQVQIKDRVAIIKRSVRSITQQKNDDHHKDKKRDIKKERKKIISDIIEETKQEE